MEKSKKELKAIIAMVAENCDRDTILHRKERAEALLKNPSLWEGKKSVQEGALVHILISAGNQRQEEERAIFIASPNLSLEGVEILPLNTPLVQALLGHKEKDVLLYTDGEGRKMRITILLIE